MTIVNGDEVFYARGFYRVRGGQVVEATETFAHPGEPPYDRSHLVERYWPTERSASTLAPIARTEHARRQPGPGSAILTTRLAPWGRTSVQLIPELPAEKIGSYRLLQRIGKGGIGHVFAAVHEHLGRRVALKVLSPDSADDPQLVARFLQEGRALEQLEHPGIVRVHDCGKLEDGTVFLAMEHLQGDPLDTWMRKQGASVSLEAALAIASQIADAMVEVHDKEIVHRDLKPANIILTPDDGAPLGLRPKVVDFGIAKVPARRNDEQADTHVKTAAHNVLGTTAYMAPEQCKSPTDVTERADVYALGGVLFELIAGRPPFQSTEDIELLFHHLNTPPPQLRDLVPTVPPLLSTFVASMLAKAPEERPSMSRCRDMLARPWKSETAGCPFPGLQPFSEAQAELFFGRERETRELVAMLDEMRNDGSRTWLQIEGPSGTGKSSLVQAGVLPRLAGQPWIVAVLCPSEDPIRSLADAIVTVYGQYGLSKSGPDVVNAMRAEAGTLLAMIERHQPPSTTLLLVIEQFEELFALGGAHLEQFDALLSRPLTKASPLRLLTTMRSDYIHRIAQTPELARILNSKAARYHLHPMREDALAQVILGMASRAGLQLSKDLADRMVRDAAGTDGRLPLLGHALRSLWSTRSGAAFTHEHYDQMGGVSGALARQAALLIDGLGEEGRERAKWLILDLVQVGRGAPDTRRPRTREEVLAAAGGDTKAEEVLARLSGMPLGSSTVVTTEPLRLVVISEDAEDPAWQRVDLVHETLLQRVPTIVSWIDAERALLERHADLEVAAHAWEQAGCPTDGLPAGSLLDHYRGYAGDVRQRERLVRMASDRARKFIDSALRLEQRRLRRQRGFVAALAVAVVAISISALVARRERERAEESLASFISTTDTIVSGADWDLGRLPHTVNVRREMLGSIDKNLQTLQYLDQPKVRGAIIETKHRRSDLARLNDTLDIAGAFITEARAMIDARLEDDPSNPELQELLALNVSKRGKLALARGRHADALMDFSKSVAVLEAMGNDGSAEHRRTLATSYAEQADAEFELGHTSIAVVLYDKAARLYEQNGETESGYDRALLASTLAQLADTERKNGDRRGAAEHLDKAKRIQESLTQAHPENMLYQLFLGRIYVSLAALRSEEGQTEEAARLYEDAVRIGETLHRGDGTQKEYGLLLCQSLQGAEAVASAQGDGPRVERLKARRRDLTRAFIERDPVDMRFQRLALP
ncbi:serine/threonine-protein kinase [Polyangium sp. 15x6]|uniref:serine/threonine-protein kinase n=1 Tax=Polyangium sp. 15x6 TaxID=3042687 RepID=UPI00249C9421|nr:serine/threonine-protein kinase [Polyangium sp. 15x6]MDI3290998.1 protein kinase [Polyangium sp. 15x6]